MAITQNIAQFPAAPDSGTDTPEQFSSKADAFVAHQADTYVTEVNTWAGQANTTQSDVNTNAQNAALSETNANNSAIAAGTSETNAGNSATSASLSANDADLSQQQAAQSETNAGLSETAASDSAAAALVSEQNAALSETNAGLAADSAEAAANYKGEWSAGTAYVVGEAVSKADIFYLCKVNNTGLDPALNPTEWQLSASVTMYSGLGDVALAGLSDGDTMYWDNVAGFWKPVSGMGIETVTVGNGTAIKYPDGTLMCFGTPNAAGVQPRVVTYPVTFVGDPVVLATCYSTASRVAVVADRTSAGCTLYVFDSDGVANTGSGVSYQAVGRWK